jgi:hypothetical protein
MRENLGRRLLQAGQGLNQLGNVTCGAVATLTLGTITCGVNSTSEQIATELSYNGPFGLLNGTVLNQFGQKCALFLLCGGAIESLVPFVLF